MNYLLKEQEAYARCLKKFIQYEKSEATILLFPPFIALFKVAAILKGTNVKIGAQNMDWEETGQ